MSRTDYVLRLSLCIVAVLCFATYTTIGLIDADLIVTIPAATGLLFAAVSVIDVNHAWRTVDRLSLHLATAGARGDYAEAELARLRQLRRDESGRS